MIEKFFKKKKTENPEPLPVASLKPIDYPALVILAWAKANKWQKLEIIAVTNDTVAFKAYYKDSDNQNQIHHEFSNFKLENGQWYYVDGRFLY